MLLQMFRTCPIDALPELLYNAACEVRGFEEDIPAESLLTDAIAAAAMAVHIDHDVRGLDDRKMPTTVNTLALVPSGLGKGTSYSLFFKAFREREALCASSAFEADQGVLMQEFILQQVSYRSLMERLHGTSRSTSIQHEDGHSFLGSDLIRGSLDKLTQVWSGSQTLSHKVHGASLVAIGGRCSFGFRIQPKLFYPFLKRTDNASYNQGLWPRAIAACYDPVRFGTLGTFMARISAGGGLAALEARFQELLSDADDRRACGVTERRLVCLGTEAAMFMAELKYHMKRWRCVEFADIEEAAARAWENTLRLAAVFHVICVGEGRIGLDFVQRAWRIVAWSLGQHRLIFVEANRPPVVQAKVKPVKLSPIPGEQRKLNADMQFMLATIGARIRPQYGNALLTEILLLTGFANTRFVKTLGWLATAGYVEVNGFGEAATVRLLYPNSGCAPQSGGQLWPLGFS